MSRRLGDLETVSRAVEVALAALYLRGLPRFAQPTLRGWPQVLRALRLGAMDARGLDWAVDQAGFELEAALLRDAGVVEAARRALDERRAITALHAAYPARWLERLGAGAPPALWWNGVLPAPAPGMTFVGSRTISTATRRWVAAQAERAQEAGFCVVSGGARGCDEAAVQAAWHRFSDGRSWDDAPAYPCDSEDCEGVMAPCVELLPIGLRRAAPRPWTLLSVCEPNADFSTPQAMERNALLYAWSELSIVGHARHGEGGAWAGATTALRRRLSRVCVRQERSHVTLSQKSDAATNALIALGAIGVADFDAIVAIGHRAEGQGAFAYEVEPDAWSYGALPDNRMARRSIDGVAERRPAADRFRPVIFAA